MPGGLRRAGRHRGDAWGWFAYAASGLLAAGLLGFLPFNYPRARIFLGDVGSQFCGFVLAVLGVVAARFEGIELSLLLVPMLLSGLLLDALFTLARRLLAGERITQPHRGHLYQVAHRAGVPAAVIAPLHWAFAAWGGRGVRGVPGDAGTAEGARSVPGRAASARVGGVRGRSRPAGWHHALVGHPGGAGRGSPRRLVPFRTPSRPCHGRAALRSRHPGRPSRAWCWRLPA